MSIDEKLDAMLRENEVSVLEFLNRGRKRKLTTESKRYRRFCSMFSVFGEKLLREVAGSASVRFPESSKLIFTDRLTALADRIKHRSPL